MTFPQTRLDITVELFIDGAWVDVTSYVYSRDDITITRGRSAEAGQVEPSTCRLTFDNRDGRFSPRNPTGTYYGKLGRNTPLRVSVENGTTAMAVPGDSAADFASAPDSAGLSITGDIDLRVDLYSDNWRQTMDFLGKWNTTGNQRSYAIGTTQAGLVYLLWSTNGTNENQINSTVPVPAHGRQAIRVTMDVNNGAAGKTVTFYTADTISGTWRQLGDAVTQAGTTSIFNSTAVADVGINVEGRVYAAKFINGIGGSEVGNPDFTAQASGATSFADAAGNTWTLQGDAALTNSHIRFHGEVSSWPQKWDPSGRDVYSQVEASGIIRRLGQGAAPLKSSLYRAITSLATPAVAYWPMEDETGATSFASGLGGTPMAIVGTPTLASSDVYASSAPLPVLRNARLVGKVPAYTSTNVIQVRFLMSIAAGGVTSGAVICRILSTGTAALWDLVSLSAGTLALRGYDAGAASLLDTGPIAFDVYGKNLWVSVELVQDGSDIDYTFRTLEVGENSGLFWTGTLSSRTVGAVKSVIVDPVSNMDDVAVGHVSVQKVATSLFELHDELEAWDGETAGNRIERLCSEEGITLRSMGDLDDTAAMGTQGRQTLLDLIREAADADLGILYEPRDVLGLAYRPRETLYNQPATLTLDYEAHQLSALEPVEDDRSIVNDMTVVRSGGSSSRRVLEEGALSIQQPPDGIGRYDSSTTVNVETEDQVDDQASWRLHLGTVDEARYPRIDLILANRSFTQALITSALSLNVGDRIVIENPPSWMPQGDITQLVQGYTETMEQFRHDIGLNCTPESSWHVGVYDGEEPPVESRYSSDGSTLNEAMTTTETDMDVATTSGPLWTTDAGDMPFNVVVGGEVMTVTAISGASSPQTFTVTRSVNGVVKTHSSGAAVELASPVYYAL